jgi:DEAD/DEAH box helicase domain-containing protein
MNKQEVLAAFRELGWENQVEHLTSLPPREAQLASPDHPLHPRLAERLQKLGVDGLYSHQARAFDAAMAGEDVLVVTGTNSGKTFCYNLPMVQVALQEPACRAIYMFPTKALAHDQLGKLGQLAPKGVLRAGTYDGDTPVSQRGSLRRAASVIFTNPDMLHVGILPGHELWTKFFKSLRLIVLDEMHVYRGVFGSHVGGIIRRLLRLCEWHHSRPQIIACTATIGNPSEVFEKLTGRKCTLIDEDGSPKAERTFVFFNPPMISEVERASPNATSSRILAALVDKEVRTLAFARARVTTELMLRYTRRELQEKGNVRPERVESYRAGYTVEERRNIESSLFNGQLLGLAATNAMELGVDVGGLDAVLMNGYPGTVSSFWQQSGRAGRGTREGLAILVAHDDPLEQFLIRDPERLLNARIENVSLNPANVPILEQQLKCAAYERPIGPHELTTWGASALDVAENLDRAGELVFKAGRFYYPSHDSPAPRVNIRGSGGDQVTLFRDGKEIGSMERWRAFQWAHEGAVYLHRGTSYVVQCFDHERNYAVLEDKEVDYYTQAIVQSVIEPRIELYEEKLRFGRRSLVSINVTDLVVGYRRKSIDGETVLGVVDLDLPPSVYDTITVRLDLPAFDPDKDLGEQIATLHALEHALLAVAPLLAGCDRGDVGSAWYATFPDTMGPALFVFDRAPGGVGLSEKLYQLWASWLQAAEKLLTSCDCETGCPSCLLSARCEANNDLLSKGGAIALLKKLQQS